jgi:hypothetical protein
MVVDPSPMLCPQARVTNTNAALLYETFIFGPWRKSPPASAPAFRAAMTLNPNREARNELSWAVFVLLPPLNSASASSGSTSNPFIISPKVVCETEFACTATKKRAVVFFV